MARRKLTFFLAVTAIALQPDIARSTPVQRYSPAHLMQLARQNAVDSPEINTYRFLREMELEQVPQDIPVPVAADESDLLRITIKPRKSQENKIPEVLAMAIAQKSKALSRKNNLRLGDYYAHRPENMYRLYDQVRNHGITFLPEEDEDGAGHTRQADDRENIRRYFSEGIREMMRQDDMENIGIAEDIGRATGYDTENIAPEFLARADDLQALMRQEEIQEKITLREAETLHQQELLEQAIRQEEIYQDSALREASSLRQVSNLREDPIASDPLRQFQIAREAFIYKEEIRQDILQKQALRQEMLRQEAVRQERMSEEDPQRQEVTLRQESEILGQMIKQEALRQENARNLEDAYRQEAELRRDDPNAEELLLQKAEIQENVRQESEDRQEEAIRQNDLLRKRISKIMQQVCINCGPKIVSVSNSQNVQI